MTRIDVGSWRLLCDAAATREAYAGATDIGPESCSCSYCRNYLAARPQIYAEPVASLFAQLGIDPPREVETYELGPAEGGRLYGGWAHFVGEIETPAPQESGYFSLAPPPDPRDFQVCFAEKCDLLPPPFQGKPVVQLEFLLVIPWLLQDESPG